MGILDIPPRRNALRWLLKPLLVVAGVTALTVFLVYRYGDSPVEKAERLFHERKLTDLRNFTRKRLEQGDANPLFYSYFALAEFSTNGQSRLGSLLNNIRAVDDRPIFRRETLVRILQVTENQKRAGEILGELLTLENPVGDEMKAVIAGLLKSPADLSGNPGSFAPLQTLFPENLRQVSARELQFRASPSTDGDVLRRLDDREKLLIRSTGVQTTVSGKAGRWAFVLDQHLVSGWVFDAYLKKLPE